MTPLLRITVVLVAVVACKGADAVTRPAAGPTGQVAPPAQQAAAALAKTLAADSLWAGIVRVTQGGKVAVEGAYGMAVPELDVPLKPYHIAPIGSNSKLFTAVSIWQLQERGKLDVTQPFTRYVNATALGLPKGWCPRLGDANGTATGPCLKPPTVEQLLRMSGGIVDAGNCEYPDGSWELKYCLQSPPAGSPAFSPDAYFSSVLGASRPADTVRNSGVLLAPFEFKPGTGHHYSNEAYQLASHIVEHVSGVPIAQYFRDHIFGPLNMTSTFLDVSGGVDGVYKNAVPYPSYMAYLNPVEIGQFAFDKGYIGNATYKAGTLKAAPPPPGQRPAAAGTAAAGAPGRWAKTGRAPAPSVPGSDFGYASGSGAIQSSAADVTTWLRALTAEPKRLGLRPETVRRMLNTSTRVPIPQGASPFGSLGGAVKALGGRLRYAQGVVVVQDPPGAPPSRLGVSGLYYKGSLGGFDSTYYLVPDKSDASKDVLAYVMTTTDTAFAPYAPFITRAGGAAGAAANKSCVFTPPAARGGDGAAHPVPAYMCDAKETLMGQGPAALLIDTYLRAFTGKGTLGIR